ncbi:MAG: chloride channel protein [Clostridium sp.]|nr:chloride channel protein [Clostridium sp.]
MEYRKNLSENKNMFNQCIDLFKKIIKWIVLSIVMGIAVGFVVGYFNIILKYANDYRRDHNYFVYFLPFAGIAIAYMYVKVRRNAYSGENLLKSEVQKAARDIPFYMIFVVFIGSLLTTLFGGSAGKEGSGVAMGGTFADYISRKLKLEKGEQRTLVISGVGSAFGVIYDVPFAGAVLGMELVIKGEFNYESLIPAFLTSVTANKISHIIGNKELEYIKLDLGRFDLLLLFKVVALGILFGLVGILFNFILDNSSKVYDLFIKNPLIKGFAGGVITIILCWILGDNYNGLGQKTISSAFETPAGIFDFFWKIIFTGVALGSVFQGGRGNPTFFVGATFGSAIADIFGLSLESVAALGMVGVFCSAQSLPMTGIAMAIEYFGAQEVLSIIVIMTTSYSISGFYDILTKRKLTKGKSTLFKGIYDRE